MRIDSVVKTFVPKAKSNFDAKRADELRYTLPLKSKPEFPKVFESLDAEAAEKESSVASYGLSQTTLEEVFLRLAEAEAAESTAEAEGLAIVDNKTPLMDAVVERKSAEEEAINKEELSPELITSLEATSYATPCM
jgi:hypothetical protein